MGKHAGQSAGDEPIELSTEEMELMLRPEMKLGIYCASGGDLELAKLGFDWLMIGETIPDRHLRLTVLQASGSLDEATEALIWAERAKTPQAVAFRISALQHSATLEQAKAAAEWIEQ